MTRFQKLPLRRAILDRINVPAGERVQREDGRTSDFPQTVAPSVYDIAFRLPKTVYILGSGQSALTGIEKIPKSAYVIALNKAIVLYSNAKVWMIATTGYNEYDWFHKALQGKAVRVFGEKLSTHFECEYSFKLDPAFQHKPKYEFIPGICRAATIAGCAINLCRDKGVKNIVLCGVDMYGDQYFDGSKSIWDIKKNAIWNEREELDKMIEMCKAEGIKFSTLTTTRLESVSLKK